MFHFVVIAGLLLLNVATIQPQETTLPSVDYETAQKHEIKPHRRTIPENGIRAGFNQLHLQLTVSATGDVIGATASGDDPSMRFWPDLQGEVYQWKFSPFEEDGKASTVNVEEYIDLVPPEKFPGVHVTPPVITQDSKVEITLQRSGCFGSCPSYTVTVGTGGLSFDGGFYVVALGKHTARIDPAVVRKLAQEFVNADFYSMNESYSASVTDNPTYTLSINIGGKSKQVVDYVGSWVGMPHVITDLEGEVDGVAGSHRWIDGSQGLVTALREELFDFRTYEAQQVLKAAAQRGQAQTVQELLNAGVPLKPIAAPKRDDPNTMPLFDHVGWLNAASAHQDVLKILIAAGASKDDQDDKDLALVGAADSGDVGAARSLISYGANPNADLRKLTITENSRAFTLQGPGAGSVLIHAAESGNPDMVREILRYHPRLEARNREGKTAMFAAGDYLDRDKDGARVECVRLLAAAGADVNARDQDGNTALHETFLTDVEEELLKLGANVNAKNSDGETPIFTTVDDDAMPLFIEHGADLTIRNKEGQTVFEAAKKRGPSRQAALQRATADRHKSQSQ